tara:strand:+ start:694 stop:1512 length:819 start_codon:yes stop_codon:yes gene_type:complete
MTTAAQTPIATLWIGDTLGDLEKLSLLSFAHQGHPVTLFHTHPLQDPRLDGVTLRHAHDVFEYEDSLLDQAAPAAFADLFRLRMVRDTDLTWVDTDVFCLKPFLASDGYLIGFESDTTVNNAVLRLPSNSEALNALIDVFSEPSFVPPWLSKPDAKEVKKLPPEQRLLGSAKQVPNAFGPLAITWALKETGEVAHALPFDHLNPVPWPLGDIYFNPHGGVEGWLTDNTMGVHMYASRVRAVHKRTPPYVGSFIANIATKVGFDFGGRPFKQV